MPLLPIVSICGTTGVGKSKLAIDLALHLKRTCLKSGWRTAKIINADAMQVYRGLDIITNKVPESERIGVPHLLLGFKEPGEQYVVGEWVQDTVKLIDEMHKNRELPIIVGGTSYWIQHLIFPDRLVSKEAILDDGKSWSTELYASLPPELLDILKNLPVEPPSAKTNPDLAFKLHSLLSALDPPVSRRWHWKDTRKVLRSLVIIKQTGKRPSDIIHEQSLSASSHHPRYSTLSFWLYADLQTLRPRLDSRVDDMISQGLLDEVRWMRDLANHNHSEDTGYDYTLGIYQSIGYREFCGFFENPSKNNYDEAVERMKISTRQYARRQISWIRNKLIPALDAVNAKENTSPLYLLDATVLGDQWQNYVHMPATELLCAFLDGGDLPDPKSLSDTASGMLTVNSKAVDPAEVLEARRMQICSVCTLDPQRPIMIEEGRNWDIHQSTRNHRRALKGLQKNNFR